MAFAKDDDDDDNEGIFQCFVVLNIIQRRPIKKESFRDDENDDANIQPVVFPSLPSPYPIMFLPRY